MPCKTSLGVTSLAATALLWTLSTPLAVAQIYFDVPSEPLSQALKALATQADLDIYFDPPTVQGLQAPALKANLSVTQALDELLSGTHLHAIRVDEHTIRVVTQQEFLELQRSSRKVATKGSVQSSAPSYRPASPPASASTSGAPARTATDDPASDGAAGAPRQLSEIVVTAEKRREPLQNVPISISVLAGRDLDHSTSLGVSETLNTVPGVATQQSYLGGGTVIAVRGVAPAFNFFSGTSPVAYYLDSVPFGLVKSAIGPDADVYDLQRIEVLRGPQGTLYGASALNGVVRILTHDPDLSSFDFKSRLADSDTRYGGNNYRADATLNAPLIYNTLALRATVGYEDYDGWIDQPDKSNANDTKSRTYRVKLKGTPSDALTVGLSAWRERDDSGAPDIGYVFDKNGSLLAQPTSTVYDVYAANIEYDFTHAALDTATGYLDYHNAGTLGLDVDPFDTPGSTFYSAIRSNDFSEELNLHSLDEENWRWSIGSMYRKGTENLEQIFTVLPVPTIQYYDTSRSYAVYGELTRLLFGDRLELTVGLRHFHDDITQEDQNAPDTPFIPASSTAEANTPRAAISWHLSDQHTLYASYSQGFRSGFPQNAAIPSDFPPARPDRLRNYELGSKGSALNGLMTYDTSVYYMDWEGIQQQLGVQLHVSHTYYPAVVNGQSASGVGTDIAISLHPSDALTLTGSVSWNDLEMDANVVSNGEVLFAKGERPTSSPETTGGLSFDYAFALGSGGYIGRVDASANYTSPQAYRGLLGPSVLVQNGDPMVFSNASFAIAWPAHWTATLYGDNLNNERGAPVKAFIGAPNWDARVRPRTFGLQVEYHLQ